MEKQDVQYIFDGMSKLAEKLETAARHIDSQINQKSEEYELRELLVTFHNVKMLYGAIDDARKQIYHALDELDKVLVPQALDKAGCTDGIRIQIAPDLGYNFRRAIKYSAKTADKEGLFVWLRDRGDEDLIQETVNAGTLATYLKDLMLNEGIEPPEEIVSLTTYYGVGINKYTPKNGGNG